MKQLLLIMLFLMPLTYAHDDSLDHKKESLNEKAVDFITQMNITINFASNKDINTQLLIDLKEQFIDDLRQALQAEDDEQFQIVYTDMKEVAKQFKKETRAELFDYADELKTALKHKISIKINVTEKNVEKTAKEVAAKTGNIFHSINNFFAEIIKKMKEE